MSASGVAPASVGFPEVDQIGDQLDSSFPTVWEASHEEAQTEKPEVLASMDYPPVEKLLASQAAEEKAIQVTSSSSSGSEDGADVDHDGESSGPPAHSLTASAFRAIFNPRKYNMSVSTRRKVYLVLGSLAINLLLPFINGVMLGLGEIFARETVAIYFGLGPKASAAKSGPQPARANVGSVGLRAAGESGAGNPKPGKAGAKTAAEVAEDAARRL